MLRILHDRPPDDADDLRGLATDVARVVDYLCRAATDLIDIDAPDADAAFAAVEAATADAAVLAVLHAYHHQETP